jgi:hypothetical protein
MSTNEIPLDRLKWVQLSSEDRNVFRNWSGTQSTLRSELSVPAEKKPVFGRRIPGVLPDSAAPSLRRKGPAAS